MEKDPDELVYILSDETRYREAARLAVGEFGFLQSSFLCTRRQLISVRGFSFVERLHRHIAKEGVSFVFSGAVAFQADSCRVVVSQLATIHSLSNDLLV